MTYVEFRNKYNGLYIDYDGAYGAQCWDLAQKYFTEVLDVPEWVLSGCGYVSNMLREPKRNDLNAYFDEVSVYNMNQGDVCIWDDPTPHIAILDNWDGNSLWFFSQNPNPCQVIQCDLAGTMYAFRRKNTTPPIPKEVTPNVDKDESKNQVKVKDNITELRVRSNPNTDSEIIGTATHGYYNFYEVYTDDNYNWYKIADDQWIANNGEWLEVYPKKEEQYKKYKIIDETNDLALIDLGQVWVKK